MDLKSAISIIKPGDFLAKVDLKSAYRPVKIHPSDYALTGLKWTFKGETSPSYMYDTKLPFGHAKSPKIFQKLSSSVCHIMKVHFNVTVIAYLDDFLIIENTFEQCSRGLRLLISTLRKLGFNISWNKVEGPSQQLIFLGVLINTTELTLSLPQEKMTEFQNLLYTFVGKKRASVKQLES